MENMAIMGLLYVAWPPAAVNSTASTLLGRAWRNSQEGRSGSRCALLLDDSVYMVKIFRNFAIASSGSANQMVGAGV